ISKVESVAEDLFEEWQEELNLYENKSLKATSARKLKQTKQRYQTMLMRSVTAAAAASLASNS
ncbi:MAG: DUF2959 domain-containing protein, partial [gamma proteobacterium symbiont of Ctena orbiculata]